MSKEFNSPYEALLVKTVDDAKKDYEAIKDLMALAPDAERSRLLAVATIVQEMGLGFERTLVLYRSA